ncbi:MAG TPA: Smr/MutS family protein [Thermoanaerobaculia bacterium]|nr:Smr/MutS family protein [Thermoanaerobaculia bacterium]
MQPMDSLTTLEFDRVLTLVAMEAKSEPGKRAVARRHPLSTLEACENAQADLGEMVRYVHTEGLLPLAGLIDLASMFQRETVLEFDEAWHAVRAVRATQAMREALLRTSGYARLAATAGNIPDLGETIAKTNKYFTKDGKLREDASVELRAIRSKVHAKRAAIQRSLTDVMNRNADAIQEPLIVMRGDRYCVPVRSDHRNAVPGILHERSGSGASFFIEPMAAIELNNDLADLLIQEREEIARITRFLSQTLFDASDAILDAVRTAGELDALQACAVFHDAIRGSRPSFSSDRTLHIIDGRHPLLDERLAQVRQEAFNEEPSDRTVIPLTIKLGNAAVPAADQAASRRLGTRDASRPAGEDAGVPMSLVVSGPNAGGKTVALKTAGLLVAMGMSGLPVPAADGTVLPCVDALHVLIGDDQSVLEHLSTFSAYLVRLKRILARATKRSIVLLDELGSGTDPEEGAALAASIIEHLLETGALVVVTTHLSALKSFAVNDTRIVNASMEFDSATGQPTYRMITGIPGRSRAIEVAKMIGLPASIIDHARERLGERYGETDSLLATLQKKMSEIVAQQDELSRSHAQLENERTSLAEKTAQLEKERATLGAKYREELDRLRDDVTRTLTNEIKTLRESRAPVNAPEVIKTVTKTIDKALEFIPQEQREVHVGDRAEHRKFKVTGDVISIAGSKAVLLVSGRKMTVDVRDLIVKVSGAAGFSPPGKSRRAEGRRSTGDDTIVVSAELNLIGQRVDDALDESDKFLDRALLEGKQAVRIIHGFGTGTLRKAIREHLRKHPAVKSWRPGEENEGGDGATVAVLDA